ncbi:hypothetical protein LEMLEM_LOCUS1958 [Lemmus lemmus]
MSTQHSHLSLLMTGFTGHRSRCRTQLLLQRHVCLHTARSHHGDSGLNL